MISRRLIFFLIFILIPFWYFSCVERDRSNPLDPKNPDTEGKPKGLKIYSELDKVFLSWKPVELSDIVGYQIYRREALDEDFIPIHMTTEDSTSYVDQNIQFEKKYIYRITVFGEDFESAPSDSVSIIPGPTSFWLGDVYSRQIIKLTHDCAHEILRISVDGYPWSIGLDEKTNNLWFTDIFMSRLMRLNLDNFDYSFVSDFSAGQLIKLKIDNTRDKIWIADSRNGTVEVVNMAGSRVQQITGFSNIRDLDVFERNGVCWVVDSGNKNVISINSNYSITEEVANLQAPSDIAINQNTGHFWIIDNLTVSKYDNNGTEYFSIDSMLTNPIELVVDPHDGKCWVLDWLSDANNSKLFCFNESGNKILEVSGFTYPENVIVNPHDHGCVVVDSGSGKIFKVSSTGEFDNESLLFDYPYGLIVIY